MAKRRNAAIACAALLLLMFATLATQGNLLSSAVANAVAPARAPAENSRASSKAETRPVARRTAGQLYARGTVAFNALKPLPPEFIDEETLWLARCIFSETKRPHEQELVAWVVRNRVETQYRGKSTYRDVVLDPMQFSAFNEGSRKREYYMGLGPDAKVTGWQTALRIAHDVRWSDAEQWRPFSHSTRHFYSEQSMVDAQHPDWASGYNPVAPARDYTIASHRFRFYEGVN